MHSSNPCRFEFLKSWGFAGNSIKGIRRHTWKWDIRDTTFSYVWHDSFECVPWLNHRASTTPDTPRSGTYSALSSLTSPRYHACIYIYMYIYIYAHSLYTHIHVYMYTYIREYLYNHMQNPSQPSSRWLHSGVILIRKDIHTWYTNIRVYTYTFIQKFMNTHMPTPTPPCPRWIHSGITQICKHIHVHM